MRPAFRSWLVLVAFTVVACGDSSGGTGGSGAQTTGTGAQGGASGSGTGGGTGGVDIGDHGPVVSLAVSPPVAVIDVVNGVAAPVQFQAIATYQDQTTAAISAAWSTDKPVLGLIGASTGELVASGAKGGVATITATIATPSLGATAQVTVNLQILDDTVGLSAAEQAAFDSPDAAPSGDLLYPYDATVFARGLFPPETMWNGGTAGDLYRVRLTETFVTATVFTAADPPSVFAMAKPLWVQLTESNAGEDLSLEITRMSSGQAHAPMTSSWRVAQGSLRGTIYYWAVNTGQLMKIAPGADVSELVFDSGPADQLGNPAPANYDGTVPPWSVGVNGKRCVACHTVSKDGSTLAAVFERKNTAPSPWGTVDLTANPAGVVQMSPYDAQTLFLALTPDGAHAVHNDIDMSMHLTDAKTGAAIPSALDSLPDNVADPVFSPSGTLLAFSSNVTGFYPVEFWLGDLDVFDFDPASLSFANRKQIAAGNGLAIAFPSFTPDSAWVVYQKGDYSRAKYGASSVGLDDLFMADVAGAVGELPLDAASGVGVLDPASLHLAYQPTINPISVGGYSWVVFVTPRDYGNKMVSSGNPTYDNRKQLWVAAIDANPQPGQDPSHPAFWLPGQDLTTINMSGYWALEPCKQEGNSCNEGFECCTGFCQPDGNGGYSCVPPPGGCSNIGEACTTAADCCDPTAECVGGFCALGQPN